MPKTTTSGQPKKSELPAPLARSSAKAQATFAKAHDSAAEQRGHRGDEEYANRVAYSAVKRSFEKVGDHWEPKDHRGPSDSSPGGPGPSRGTKGGIDANASKSHLMRLARRLDVRGRSSMTKDELVDALQKESERADARARRGTRASA